MKTKLLLAALLASALPSSQIRAEEGGSGHYLPGAMASYADGVPPAETFITRLNLASYEGSCSRG